MSRAKGYLKVRNLSKYQHYKDRNPPWVKLHQELLEDYDFASMRDCTKYHAVAIILLASRTDNHIPADSRWIAGKISATDDVDLPSLQTAEFLVPCACKQCASRTLAICTSEGEAETESEGEKNSPPTPPLSRGAASDRDQLKEVFEAWKRTLPAEARDRVKLTKQRAQKYSARRRDGYTHDQILAAVTNYVHDPWEGRLANATARDFSTLLRDGGQVEKFSAMRPGGRSGPRKTDPRTEADLLLQEAWSRARERDDLDADELTAVSEALQQALDQDNPVEAVKAVRAQHGV